MGNKRDDASIGGGRHRRSRDTTYSLNIGVCRVDGTMFVEFRSGNGCREINRTFALERESYDHGDIVRLRYNRELGGAQAR